MTFLSWFDNRTLFSCQLLLASMFSIVFFGMRRAHPNFRGVGSIALSFFFGTLGILLFFVRGNSRDFLSMTVANILILASFTYCYRGVLRFLGDNRSLHLIWAADFVSVCIVIYYSHVQHNIVPRIVSTSIVIALNRGLTAFVLFRRAEGRTNMRLFGLTMTLFTAISLFRALFAWLHGAPENYLQRNSFQTPALAADVLYICLAGLFFFTMISSEVLAIVKDESEQDPLSGAFNRRGIELRLNMELKRIERSGAHLSIALFDVDHFKIINDSAGHAAGDSALRGVATAIASHLRAYDYLGRFGGDEFLLLFPQTHCVDAKRVVDRLAQHVRASVRSGIDVPLTLSVGLTEAVPGDSPASLLARADKALYAAKHAGRNCSRTILYEPKSEPVDMQSPLLAS
jgi:diguanylate cyclase (GGDEF)-like protein